MTTLLLMKGHPATGKSTLAQALARRLRWPLVDKDDVKDFTLHLPDPNGLAYSIMWQVTARQLALGLSVIVDSPLSYPAEYAAGRDLAAGANTRLLVVETVLPPELWRQRLEERSASASTHKIRGWERMQAQLRDYAGCWQYPIPAEHHLSVETSGPLERAVDLVLARIGAEP